MGGDLAVLKGLATRKAVREGLKLVEGNPVYTSGYAFGLHKVANQWRWVDGTLGTADEISWYQGHPQQDPAPHPMGWGDCARFMNYPIAGYEFVDLMVEDVACDPWSAPSICEFKC